MLRSAGVQFDECSKRIRRSEVVNGKIGVIGHSELLVKTRSLKLFLFLGHGSRAAISVGTISARETENTPAESQGHLPNKRPRLRTEQ